MAELNVKTIRASETVSPYGPGAIVDILGQSFMVPTGDRWPSTKVRSRVSSDRLVDALGVDDLWAAPTTHSPENQKTPGLEFERFPGWLFCQVCRRMVKWTRSMETGRIPQCPEAACDGRLVPMRFVAVCMSNSHLADIPWVEWMHRDHDGDCAASDKLKFESAEGRAEGLSSLQVRCDRCGHRRSLGDLRRDVLAVEGFTCRGKQPWESSWGQCGKPIDPQQRGATSLHFSDTMSAIDIPTVESRTEQHLEKLRAHKAFAALAVVGDETARQILVAQIAAETGIPEAVILELAVPAPAGGTLDVRATRSGLLAAEYEAFIAALTDSAPTEGFSTRVTSLSTDAAGGRLGGLLSDVVLVDRLRDVRAVLGFRRYTPEAALVAAAPVLPHERKWLPAIEGHGEGIFIRFPEKAVRAWAGQEEVQSRGDQLLANQNPSGLGGRLHVVSPEYVLLHTFAHLMMRELAFGSGYTAASIRERIYCESDGDYGVFIYTTSSDVEGTLGGLVRQGEPDLLAPAIVRALEQAAWCPNDPVCIESEPQSIDGLNLAACHACCLASETSCESQNLLLDRALVVGSDDVRGYFDGVLDAILGQRTGRASEIG
ncbi:MULTISPECIES: DUF1998 domain-containing protein [unclassified Microbacterium]|uniref:DUF1998 domain-containing protein n=1 Tax=unclassified Microbacterium TaxID=2609290 RepID=UPI00214BEFEC|nr:MULTISPECIES: DUF1998 domain-containing protein [unclassified Microbacterium]MCR2784153.1 DUF1998 domain-containing protein [Microbacterium sp. zg.B96]WIM15012.1 DUF1998 domain-containing protein [Microbacterium sp. zg-B96]